MKKTLSLILFLSILGTLAKVQPAFSQEPFIGEIRLFAGNFAPRGWAFCDGQLLPIAQNQALFSIIGTTYGGDGRTTFALPDLRGRAPIHAGSGPGLTPRVLGARGGEEQVTLTESQLPQHTHSLMASTAKADTKTPTGEVLGGNTKNYTAPPTNVDTDISSIGIAGEGQAHNNMQPYLTLNYIIALQGIYPSRN